jgi:hypothetical protein
MPAIHQVENYHHIHIRIRIRRSSINIIDILIVILINLIFISIIIIIISTRPGKSNWSGFGTPNRRYHDVIIYLFVVVLFVCLFVCLFRFISHVACTVLSFGVRLLISLCCTVSINVLLILFTVR